MHLTRAAGDDVGVHCHISLSPIAIDWMIQMKLDDRLLFLVCMPEIAMDVCIAFICFT